MADWNQQIIDEFRANDGRVGGNFEGRTLLLLHHTGAKTGTERVNPLAYQRLSDDSVAIFASKGGAPTNSRLVLQRRREPRREGRDRHGDVLRPRPRRRRRRARDDLEKQKADWPGFADYEKKTEGIREIPVVILDLAR